MADLQRILEESKKLHQNIRQLIGLSTYNEYDDLSGLKMDLTGPEQVLVWNELRLVMEKLTDVESLITYLSSPIREVSRLQRNGQGKYESDDKHC